MALGDPIKLGSASGAALVPMANSRIITDDYGVQRGTVVYQLGDQSLAQGSRLTLGAAYGGTLPQFNGFLVNRSGDITGMEGTAAQIEVEYVALDPKWINIPLDSADLELKQIKYGNTSGFGTLYDSFLTLTIPILHPTVNYRYSSVTAKSDLGHYGTPAGAPSLGEYIFHLDQMDISSAQAQIEQKVVTGTSVLLTIHTDGTCSRTTFPYTVTVTGLFGTTNIGLINFVDLHFKPDPNLWLCVKQDQKPIAGGSLYEIDEQWKTQYVFSGTTPGDWWNNSHNVQCT